MTERPFVCDYDKDEDGVLCGAAGTQVAVYPHPCDPDFRRRDGGREPVSVRCRRHAFLGSTYPWALLTRDEFEAWEVHRS